MTPVKIVVVEAGHIAEGYHLPSLSRLAAEGMIELAALCDIAPGRAEAMARQFGFDRHFTDYRKMLDTVAPTAGWVLVPTDCMREVAGYTLATQIPTFMEKPPG